MHFASRRLILYAALTMFFSAATLVAANGDQKEKTITVTEGTGMAVTVSPDRKTILADIQGLIFAIPFNGGAGKQLTTPMQEASHPDWSAVGNLVALQCYAGGTRSSSGRGTDDWKHVGLGDDAVVSFSGTGCFCCMSSEFFTRERPR